jgi:hypothetical protein
MVSIEKWIRPFDTLRLPFGHELRAEWLMTCGFRRSRACRGALPSRNEVAAPDGFALRQAQGLEQAKRAENGAINLPSQSRALCR